MKNLSRLLLAAMMVAPGLYSTSLMAQEQNAQTQVAQQVPEIPVDANVRIGRLPNGLTYYLRHNELPAQRAEFYIAQKVGSIQEEPNQRGLAHFLEHMCFNGTTHFPGDALKQYLQRIGVKFGENLNAYTSVDETVYNISNVPVIANPEAVDSCLWILHDWSNDLTLDPVEIDKERGVINEEWRMRMSAGQRLMERSLKYMYPGTKYADCFPIGTMDVVMNFPYQDLRSYYEKWYRPDLQAIVVVGDIDVDAIEAKIKSIFADIPAQPNGAERVYYPVPDNDEPIIVVDRDKEMTRVQARMYFKNEAYPENLKNRFDYMAYDYACSMIGRMLNSRLSELQQTANPPFVYAGTGESNFYVAKTKSAFTATVMCKEDEIERGISALAREIARVRKYGFTDGEYDRAKANFLSALENQYNERDKVENGSYVNSYVRHFLDNEPIPGVENECMIYSQIANSISLDMVNQMIGQLVTDNNLVVTLYGPEKDGLELPAKEDISALLANVAAEEVEPYVDNTTDRPLMGELPAEGKIVAEKALPKFGATELTLSNGVKVILKETDFKADEISMTGMSFGGSSLFDDKDVVNIKSLGAVAGGGLGDFSAIDLRKAMAGKRASVAYSINSLTERVSGGCSPKDLETMLQLTYLTFTSPRRDDDAFKSFIDRTKSALLNSKLNPQSEYVDSVYSALYMGHPRAVSMKYEMVDSINYDRLLQMYNDRFCDAGDFTFVMVGNVNIAADKELIAKYLGALPTTGRKETYRDNKMYIRKGEYHNVFIRKQNIATSLNMLAYTGDCKYNQRNDVLMDMASQVLEIIYTNTVREDEGGAYNIGVNGSIDKFPKQKAVLEISFSTDPAKRDKLMGIITDQMKKLAAEGPDAEILAKVKEFMLKKRAENVRENGFWMGAISENVLTGVDMVNGYEKLVESITAGDIKKFVNALIKQGNVIEVSMISPEEESK
jgi:zinc protease